MVSMLSDIGNYRKTNQDSIGSYEEGDFGIYVIADGMGGHNAGEIASKLAVETTLNYIKNHINENDIAKILNEAIQLANKKIYEISQNDSHLSGMGTTITACIKKGNYMAVANVGDSSCFVIKDNNILKITKDHSLVQQLVDNGTITKEEATNHPNKNIITRALGVGNYVNIDIFNVDLVGINIVILCTDGLTNDVTCEEIKDVLLNNNYKQSCYKLIELSKSKCGRDNISVIVFEGECERNE